jgi:hypothetical protein
VGCGASEVTREDHQSDVSGASGVVGDEVAWFGDDTVAGGNKVAQGPMLAQMV